MTRLLKLVLLLFLWGCSSSVPTLKKADYYFEQGMKALEKKRCLKAIEEFERVVNNYPGSSLVADAQYYLGEAHFCNHDYVQAVFEYQRLLDIYPSSQWADKAQFQIGESFYKQLRRSELDQKETYESLTYFRQFIDDNPDSPMVSLARERIVECRSRLAKKQYLAARLYHKQGHLESALITYKEVLLNFPDTPWYCETLMQMGAVARSQENPTQARVYWKEVLQECSDERLKKKVKEQLDKLEPARGD